MHALIISLIILVVVLFTLIVARYFWLKFNKENAEQEKEPEAYKVRPHYNSLENALYNCRDVTPTISIIERLYGTGEQKHSRFIVKIKAEHYHQSRDFYYDSNNRMIYLTDHENGASELKTVVEAEDAVKNFLSRREQGIKENEANTLVSIKVIKNISANLPPTTEELVEHVNQMSETDFNNFLSLLDQGGRYPLRKREEVLVLK